MLKRLGIETSHHLVERLCSLTSNLPCVCIACVDFVFTMDVQFGVSVKQCYCCTYCYGYKFERSVFGLTPEGQRI